MKELITMWKNTRMIVLVSVSAAVYAVVLIPFKVGIPLVPGFTEVRPASVLPIIFSLMFGPAAAWGTAIGNVIGDVLGGTAGPGMFPGIVGNFLYGYIPYKMWRAFSKSEPVAKAYRSSKKSLIAALITGVVIAVGIGLLAYFTKFTQRPEIYVPVAFAAVVVSVFLVLRFLSIRYFIIALSASAACGIIIGWGVHIMGLVPFPALGNMIVLNNLFLSAILGPLLLPVLYPVVKRMGLLYTDVMGEEALSKPRAWASGLMFVVIIASLIVGNWIAIGRYETGVLKNATDPKALFTKYLFSLDEEIPLLFSVEMESQSDLDNSTIPGDLRQKFEDSEISLSEGAPVTVEEKGTKWLITDEDKVYTVLKQEDELNVYEIQTQAILQKFRDNKVRLPENFTVQARKEGSWMIEGGDQSIIRSRVGYSVRETDGHLKVYAKDVKGQLGLGLGLLPFIILILLIAVLI